MPPTRAHLQTIASFVSKDTQYDPFMYASPNVEDFKLTTPIRMQGFLKKRGRSKAGWKTWFTRWFVLDRCSLVYYESQAAFMAGKHPQAVMPLDDRFEIHPEPTDASGIKKSCLDRVFEIVASPTFDKALSGKTEQVLVVKARTLQLRGDWFEALQTAYCITRITGSICGPELPRFLRTSTTNQMADSALDHAVSLTDSVQDGSDDNTERDEDKYSDDNMYPPQLSEDGDEIPPPPVWTPKSERHHLEMREVQKVMDQLADSVSRVLTPPLLSRVTQLAKSNESPPTEWGTLQSSAKLRQSSIPKAQWQSIQPSAMKPVSRFPMSPERNMKETIAAYDDNMGPKSARYARDAIGLASPSYPRDRPVAKPASHNSKPTMYSISPAVKPHRQVTFQLSPKPSAPTSFARSQTFSESVSSPRHSPRSETRAPRSALKPTRSADYFSPRLGQEYAPSRGLTSFEAAESSASLSHLKSSNGLIVTYTKDAPARMQNRDRERDRETSNRKGVALRMDYLKSISVDSMHS